MCLYCNKCYEVRLNPLEHYLSRGLVLRRIFAVDYSSVFLIFTNIKPSNLIFVC
jgi:hypothetical protein